MIKDQTILITGGAGFIGSTLVKRFLNDNKIVMIDNLNSYYEVQLKLARLADIKKHIQEGKSDNFLFYREDLCNEATVSSIIQKIQPNIILHLAAQAGVRYAAENPNSYLDSNIIGTVNLLKACYPLEKKPLFIYASSSSVYGINNYDRAESEILDTPPSLYASTKLATEHFVKSYGMQVGMSTVGLRFFNVYGPWGRPDAFYYICAKAILAKTIIRLHNYGKMSRDMTYVDDVVESISRILGLYLNGDEIVSEIFNIGNQHPQKITDVVKVLEDLNGQSATVELVEKFSGENDSSRANTQKLSKMIGFTPNTGIYDGLKAFNNWYKSYHKVS